MSSHCQAMLSIQLSIEAIHMSIVAECKSEYASSFDSLTSSFIGHFLDLCCTPPFSDTKFMMLGSISMFYLFLLYLVRLIL